MKNQVIALFSALALTVSASSAFAASKNVIINANVVGTCAFVGGEDVTINLGDLKAGAGDQTKSSNTSFWCSTGVPYTLSTDDGQNGAGGTQKKMKSGDAELPYELTLSETNGTGAGISAPIEVEISATVLGNDIDTAPVQSGYTDTVVLTLTP